MPLPGGKLAAAYWVTGCWTGTSGLANTYPIGDEGPRLVASKATSRTLSHGRLCAVRSGALRETETLDRESIRRLRCGVSISTLSVWVPKKSCRTVRSAGRGRISTVCETNCCPLPLLGSSRSEHRAKLTGLS